MGSEKLRKVAAAGGLAVALLSTIVGAQTTYVIDEFDQYDSTVILQRAIDSGADKVVVPNTGKDWFIRPITLAADQELFFEPGVVVTARKGFFQGTHDCLFTAEEKSNVKLSGYGATFRMRKSDYTGPSYVDGQWRHGLRFEGCSNVEIAGLTIEDTGGDAIYMGDQGAQGYNQNVTIRDVVLDNNYRQGISIISAKDVLIEDSTFRNTSGTGPAAGIDLEPDTWWAQMSNIVVRDCLAENNQGPGFIASPAHLTSQSADVSVLFENCRVQGGQGHGFMVSGVKDDGPQGTISFVNCHAEDTFLHGARVLDKSAGGARVLFEDCSWKNVATGPLDAGGYDGVPNLPIMIHLRGTAWSQQPGGVDFVNCTLEDSRDRPAIAYKSPTTTAGLYDVHGTITVRNPNGVRADLGSRQTNVTLRVVPYTSEAGDQPAPWFTWSDTSNGSYLDADGGAWEPVTMTDFGGTYAGFIRRMKWVESEGRWVHTDSAGTAEHPDHGRYGPGSATLGCDAGLGGGAFPGLSFRAPVDGIYSLDGVALISGQHTRLHVQTYTGASGQATALAGNWASGQTVTSAAYDLGAEPTFQDLLLEAGDHIVITFYTVALAGGPDGFARLDGPGDPVRIVWRVLAPWLDGDANGDGLVDDQDLSLLLANWGQDATGDPDGGWGRGEFNGATPVDDSDLSLLLANWSASSGAIGVPEPAVLGLLAVGGLSMLRRRR